MRGKLILVAREGVPFRAIVTALVKLDILREGGLDLDDCENHGIPTSALKKRMHDRICNEIKIQHQIFSIKRAKEEN